MPVECNYHLDHSILFVYKHSNIRWFSYELILVLYKFSEVCHSIPSHYNTAFSTCSIMLVALSRLTFVELG